jgi:hypothetical protein
MDRVAALEKVWSEGRYGDGFSLEFFQCRVDEGEVILIDQDQEIEIAAKFRRAVEHARLAAHEKSFRAILPH